MILLLVLARLIAGSAAMNMNGFFVMRARSADELRACEPGRPGET